MRPLDSKMLSGFDTEGTAPIERAAPAATIETGSFDKLGAVTKRFPQIRSDFLEYTYDVMGHSAPGVQGEELIDRMENDYYENPEPVREMYKEPKDAPSYENMIKLAKEKGVKASRGVNALLVEGILTSGAGGTVRDVYDIYEKDREQMRLAEEREIGLVEKGEAQRIARKQEQAVDTAAATEARRQAALSQIDSDETNSIRNILKRKLENIGWGDMAASLDNMTGNQLLEQAASFAPEIKAEYEAGITERAAVSEFKRKQEMERLEQLGAPSKVEAATVKSERDMSAAEIKYKRDVRKAANQPLIAEYSEDRIAHKKYKPSITTVNRIIDLSGDVETGQISGLEPVVYLRKLFGDDELQELESLIKGLPLPLLKATFGGSFSLQEGETLAQSLANIKMDGPAFTNAMLKIRNELDYNEAIYQQKTKHYRKTGGDLIDFEHTVELPAQGTTDRVGKGGAIEQDDSKVRMRVTGDESDDTWMVPKGQIKEAQDNGMELI